MFAPASVAAPSAPADSAARFGVGIDTSRYGHYAAFLNSDLQQAAGELEVVESAAGYARLRQRFTDLVNKHHRIRFFVRLDVAGDLGSPVAVEMDGDAPACARQDEMVPGPGAEYGLSRQDRAGTMGEEQPASWCGSR